MEENDIAQRIDDLTGETREELDSPNEESPIIPPNSGGEVDNSNVIRFSGAKWFEEITKTSIVLIGAGGIGSFTGLLVSRLKPSVMSIIDPDLIENVNLAGQLYHVGDVGMSKVQALRGIIQNMSSYYHINAYRKLLNDVLDSWGGPIDVMICGLDNMRARQDAFEHWKRLKGSRSLFIDGRLAAEEFQVFSILGSDDWAIKEYEQNWLFSDEEAEEAVCTYKQTSFMAAMIASVITNLVVNYAANVTSPSGRPLPFMVSYAADTMHFKTVG